jgi:hypothetical protein
MKNYNEFKIDLQKFELRKIYAKRVKINYKFYQKKNFLKKKLFS